MSPVSCCMDSMSSKRAGVKERKNEVNAGCAGMKHRHENSTIDESYFFSVLEI